MKMRTVVVPIISNDRGEYLLCKMPKHRGVFPDQWGLPGGGIEPNEKMYDALHREVREELGITIANVVPWSFRDDIRIKTYGEGKAEEVYMVYLIFDCKAADECFSLNEEFEAYAWVKPGDLSDYDLNEATRLTFTQKGFLKFNA